MTENSSYDWPYDTILKTANLCFVPEIAIFLKKTALCGGCRHNRRQPPQSGSTGGACIIVVPLPVLCGTGGGTGGGAMFFVMWCHVFFVMWCRIFCNVVPYFCFVVPYFCFVVPLLSMAVPYFCHECVATIHCSKDVRHSYRRWDFLTLSVLTLEEPI